MQRLEHWCPSQLAGACRLEGLDYLMYINISVPQGIDTVSKSWTYKSVPSFEFVSIIIYRTFFAANSIGWMMKCVQSSCSCRSCFLHRNNIFCIVFHKNYWVFMCNRRSSKKPLKNMGQCASLSERPLSKFCGDKCLIFLIRAGALSSSLLFDVCFRWLNLVWLQVRVQRMFQESAHGSWPAHCHDEAKRPG